MFNRTIIQELKQWRAKKDRKPRIGWRPGWKEKYTNNGSTI